MNERFIDHRAFITPDDIKHEKVLIVVTDIAPYVKRAAKETSSVS